LLLAGAAVASYVVLPPVVTARLSALLEGVLPPSVVDIDPIMTAAIAAQTQIGLFVIVLSLLAGRRILGALVTALNFASDADTRHEKGQRRALVELVALAGIGVLFSVSTREHSTDGMTMPCSRSWIS